MIVQLTMTRKDGKPLQLPQHYNHIIQAFIYNNIDPELAKFLHDEGYEAQGRTFKMFTFSNFYGRYEIDKKNGAISFNGPVILTISSPLEKFVKSIVNTMLMSEELFINRQEINIESVEMRSNIADSEDVMLQLISPVVAYSTIQKEDGKKFTYFYRPMDSGYDEMITENLKKKYEALYGETAPEGIVKIVPCGELKFRMSKYKDFIIKGYTGKVKVRGPVELINMGIQCGFGSKNSQGFGCVKIL